MNEKRLKILLYNAIISLKVDNNYTTEELLEELGCTEEEYKEIMEDE